MLFDEHLNTECGLFVQFGLQESSGIFKMATIEHVLPCQHLCCPTGLFFQTPVWCWNLKKGTHGHTSQSKQIQCIFFYVIR